MSKEPTVEEMEAAERVLLYILAGMTRRPKALAAKQMRNLLDSNLSRKTGDPLRIDANVKFNEALEACTAL